MWPPDDFLALPEDAIAFAWSAPMRELATQIGISDVALKKMLNKQGIVTPPQGHWNRVHAGRAVAEPPRPPARRPGERGRIALDRRFRALVAEAGPIAEEGPFVSSEVPEDLGELRAQELARIGRAPAPRDLSRAHPGLARLLRREDARRAKAAASTWHWDQPHFDTPLGQRQLRLLSGLFVALARRGHGGEAWEENEELRGMAIIGEEQLRMQFAMIGKHRSEMRGGCLRPARDLPARTPLQLTLTRALRQPLATTWADAPGHPLEKQLAEIVADLIVAGEASFRQGLVEACEEAERRRRWDEEWRLKRLAELNRQRLGHLEQSGALLRQAEELRALVERVGAAVGQGTLALSDEELASWRAWALARADALDPVLSGQVLSHLRPQESG